MDSKHRLLELDGLRGLAALAVCLLHFGLFDYGVTGVDLFFMISGFVIYLSLLNSKSIAQFWWARVVRLYPVYWLSLLIGVLSMLFIAHATVPHEWRFIAGNFSMLQPIFKSKLLVDPYWTLYVELTFYALISLIWRLKRLKHIENIMIVLLVVFGAMVVAFKQLYLTSPGYTRFFVIVSGLLPLIYHFQLFAAGIVFYLVRDSGYTLKRVVILAICLVMVVITHDRGGRVFYYMNAWQHLLCCVVFFGLFAIIDRGPVSFFRSRVLVFLGAISYALYVIHQSFGRSVYQYLAHTNELLGQVVGILLSIGLAYLITYYFDVPLRKYLKKKVRF